jgi:hypothetical protein
MAKKCYFAQYIDCIGRPGSAYICSENLYDAGDGHCGGPRFASSDHDYTVDNASAQQITISVVDCALCAGCNCTDLSNEKCDCLNGGCVPAATYNTPGKYANLAACESGCAKDSTCNGECVSAADLAALQQAAALVQPRICGS